MAKIGAVITALGVVLFLFGYAAGNRAYHLKGQKIKAEVTAEKKSGVSKESLTKDFAVAAKQIEFQKKLVSYAKELNKLQAKFNELAKLADYLDHKAAAGENLSSVEASLVYEAQYRNSLLNILNVQKSTIGVYQNFIQTYKSYVEFLEGQR